MTITSNVWPAADGIAHLGSCAAGSRDPSRILPPRGVMVRRKMRRWLGLAALVGLLGGSGYLLKDQGWGSMKLGGKPSPLESRWRTEEEWLVDSIVRDIAEMARFASAGRVLGTGDLDVT